MNQFSFVFEVTYAGGEDTMCQGRRQVDDPCFVRFESMSMSCFVKRVVLGTRTLDPTVSCSFSE